MGFAHGGGDASPVNCRRRCYQPSPYALGKGHYAPAAVLPFYEGVALWALPTEGATRAPLIAAAAVINLHPTLSGRGTTRLRRFFLFGARL